MEGKAQVDRGSDAAPSRFDEQLTRLDDVVGVRADGLAPPPTRVDGPDTTPGPVRGDDASAPPVRDDAGGAGHADDSPAVDQPGHADGDAGTGGSGGEAPAQPAPVKDAPTGPITDVTGKRDLTPIIDASSMTRNQLADYLDVKDPKAGAVFRDEGKWPEDQRVPADASFLGEDGLVDWEDIPYKGFALNDSGASIIDENPHLPAGTLLDRAGSPDGVFVSPVPHDGVPYTHEQRATPWVRDEGLEHVYRTTGDLGDIRGAYDRSSALRQEIFDRSMIKHKMTWDRMHARQGPIARAFGLPGGGEQILLPMSVQDLMDIGLIEEIGKAT
jgi:hypothetical protein